MATVALLAGLLQVVVFPSAANALATPVVNAPMRMAVGSDNPLLLTQMNIGNDMGQTEGFKRNWNSGWSFAQIWASTPDDLKNNIGFVLHQGHTALADNKPAENERWLEDNIKEADALGIPVFILWDEGRTLKSNSTRFTFLERMYQTYPHFMGTVVSEQADTLGDLNEALRIANLYGGFHILGSLEETNGLATFLDTQANWNSARSYRKNFIFNPKNFHENFESVNAWTQGAWLSGAFDNWGPYFDGYPYYGCGFFGQNPTSYSNCGDRWSRSMAETLASTMMLDQWQNGATVFHMENQLDIPTTGSLFSPYFYQSILPAMRYILSHHTPTRADIVAQTKVVLSEAEGSICTLTDTEAGRSNNPCRPTFYSMYEKQPALTAVQKSLPYYLRSDGRYGIIPRIPKLASAATLAQFETVLTKSTYNPTLIYGDARDALFDSKYTQISAGEAFVQKSGSSWLTYNTNDRDNFNEDATLFLSGSTFTQLQMPEITPHTWAMVTEEGTSISVLLDNYRTDRAADLLSVPGVRDMEFNRNFVKYAYVPNPQDAELRTTTMTFDVAAKPALTISGYDANSYSYTEKWDVNTHQYTLTVQSNGVVDITLSTAGTETGWTSVAPGSGQIASATGATEFAFDGTSVAWAVPSGATGTASVSIDGVLQNSTVDLSTGGTVFRATGLSNSVHVLRIEGGSIPVDHFSYKPSVEHSATTIETNDFNYGTAAADEDILYGSDGWRVINGKLKLVGFVFPFYGDTTVYNTNVKLQNVKYEAKVTLIKGTSGSIFVRGNEDSKAGYFFRLDPNRTAEGRTGTATYSCSLHSGNATGLNTWGAVATCPTSLTLNRDQEYSVVVTANGSTITASIDGTQVLSYSSAAVSSGYTGVRAPQAQSDSGTRLGQFVQIDDVKLTNLDTSTVVYQSSFDAWADATGWMTETPLVFDWNTKADPRSSFTFPWQWTTTAGTWQVVENNVDTSGFSGYYSAVAPSATDFTAFGGGESAWSANGGYDYWAWLNVTSGNQAGVAVRATDSANMYQARLNVSTQTVSFGKLVNGTWTELASAASPVALAPNSWDLVKVTAHRSLFTVIIGGKTALTVTDTTFASGGAGVWVPAAGSALIEDARVVARPASVSTVRPAATIVAPDGISGKHVTGYNYVAIKTARTKQPTLPTTVTARYSDGTTGQVAVAWPAITSTQLAVSTNPTKTGPNVGKFTLQGAVAGTSLTVPALVTVMPNLTTTLNITGSYNSATPTTPTQMPGTGTFSDGTSTWTKTLYVRWLNTPATTPGSPTTQVISGEINGYPWEKVSATVTVTVPAPNTAPGSPIAVTAIGANAQAVVSWTAPTSTGGAAITGYTATASPGGAFCTTTGATTCAVTGLTNGTPYTFTVTAANSVGTSAASDASSAATPQPGASVPSAPTAATAVAGSGQATVSWTASASTGGATITGYTVTASTSGASCTTTGAASCVVYGLTNGTAYTFTVTAQNAAGSSPASTATASVTPAAVNLALNKTVTSYYTFGGSTATNNTNRAPGKMVDGVVVPSTGASTDSGYFTGGNAEGALTNYVAPNGEMCSWAYIDLGADYQIGSYSVMFGQNQTTGGNKMWDSPYAIQVLSAAAATASTMTLRNSSPCPARTFVTGKGTGNFNAATYVVSPSNDIWTTVSTGVGTLSFDNYSLSAPVTARYVRILLNEPTTAQIYGTAVMELAVYAPVVTPPGAPTAASATAGDGSAAVSWTAPASSGGSAITAYTVTAAPGGQTCTTASTGCTVNGLTNGTAYTFTVKATNAAGPSSASTASWAVTPIGPQLAVTADPQISGNVVVGQTLTVSSGTWNVSGADYSYQWTRDGIAVTDATASSYLVGTADVGESIAVVVSATKTGHPSGTATADAVVARRVHTTTSLSASAGAQSYGGAPVSLTITAQTEYGSVASGTVTIKDGSTTVVEDVELDPAGTTTFDLSSALAAGSHSFTATFVPDDTASVDGSVSAPSVVTVSKASTATSFTLSRTSQAFGTTSPAIVTVTVLAGADPVAGTVAVKDGATVLAAALPLDAFGQVSYTLPGTLSVGSHGISVEFSPTDSASYDDSVAGTQQFAVATSMSTTSVTTSAGSQQYGSAGTVSLTVSVSLENGDDPTGTIAVLDGTMELESGLALHSDGTVSYSLPPALVVGNHYLSAVFTPSDETAVASSQSTPARLVIVTAASSSVTLSLSAATQVIGATGVTATAVVTVSNGQAAAGTVTIMDGTTVLASGLVPASDGEVEFTLSSSLATGSHAIEATFVPTDAANVTGATSATVALTVSRATTATTAVLSSASQVFGAAAPAFVSVAVEDALGAPGQGTVAVLDGTTTLAASLSLDANGEVVFMVPASLAVGAHSLSMVFTPAAPALFDASSSSASVLTVVKAATTTTVTLPAGTSQAYGAAHVVEVTVVSQTPAALNGTVDVLDGTTVVATGLSLSYGGTATYLLDALLASGAHALSARFVPSISSGQLASASAAVTLTVGPPPPPPPPTPPVWSDSTVATAQATVALSDGVFAVGSGTISYSVTAGSLPAWLALNPTTGAITGTPGATDAAEAYSFTVTATSPHGHVDTTVADTVAAAPVIDLDAFFTAGTLAEGSTGEIAIEGAGSNVAWSLTLFSTPVVIASGSTSGAGTASATFVLPAGIDAGAHRVELKTLASDGSVRTATVWFTVLRNGTIGAVSLSGPLSYFEAALAGTGVELIGAGSAALLLLAIGLVLMMARRRARLQS